ncbi:MAG: 16S rRNA (cytidine(1402)-2'-O)-methyltransferase [Oscillospiraceae bacterium]|nr:16S rRNA (cytidine(1402)-2'-O)-methyltransferase [Oscillospiraceae bacterium]
MPGTLYLIGTPIGNLSDFSPRAVETLSSVDFIAAEDTRVTLKLLNHFDIHKPLVSYYEHNKYASGEKIVQRILAGESCGLVTDAGMPAVSDPGEDIVRMCMDQGIPVTTIPGPTALITALVLSGLPTGRFCFEGFLSTNNKSRREHLEELQNEARTMIFYEAPHKLRKTLSDLKEAFGDDRRISLCRELTKLHEEVLPFSLSEAVRYYEEHDPKGEYVLILEGRPEESDPILSEEEALALVAKYRAEGRSLKESCKLASSQSGYSKNELYALATSK